MTQPHVVYRAFGSVTHCGLYTRRTGHYADYLEVSIQLSYNIETIIILLQLLQLQFSLEDCMMLLWAVVFQREWKCDHINCDIEQFPDSTI